MANPIDHIIGYLSPKTGKERLLNRQIYNALKQKSYEAAKPSRLHKVKTSKGDGDSIVEGAIVPLRGQARHLDENYDLAGGVLNDLVNKTIGSGLRSEPQVKDKDGKLAVDFNKALLKLHQDWIKKPEVTGEYHYFRAQNLAARSWFRDGEVFTQHLEGNVPGLDHQTIVPYSIELIEADYVPHDFDREKENIIQGVKKNAWQRPIAYYVYKKHPGNNRVLFRSKRHVKEISADNMQHQKMVKRIAQTRGITVFANVIARFSNLKDYEESEQIAAKVAAAMCAFIQKDADGTAASNSNDTDGNGNRLIEFEPGMVFDQLLPGESVGVVDTKRPNTSLEPYRNAQIRAVAAGTGSNYSSIAKNYNGTFSAQRQEMVESYVYYDVLREDFIQGWTWPQWMRFVRAAITANVIEVPTNIDRQTLYDCDFRGPAMPWIDPQKEANAAVTLVEARLKSRSQTIRERGDNPADVREQIAQEHEEDKHLGLAPSQPAISKPSDSEVDDDEPIENEENEDESTNSDE